MAEPRHTRMRLVRMLPVLALVLAAFSLVTPAAHAETAPARPTNFELYYSSGYTDAIWHDNATNESGFRVQICAGECVTKDWPAKTGTGNVGHTMVHATNRTCGWVWAFVNTSRGRIYSASSNYACSP